MTDRSPLSMPCINRTHVRPMDSVQYRSDFWLAWHHNAALSSANDQTMTCSRFSCEIENKKKTIFFFFFSCAFRNTQSVRLGFVLKHTPFQGALTEPGDSHGNMSNYMRLTQALWQALCASIHMNAFPSCSRLLFLAEGRRWEKQINASEREYLGSVSRGTTNRAGVFFFSFRQSDNWLEFTVFLAGGFAPLLYNKRVDGDRLTVVIRSTDHRGLTMNCEFCQMGFIR